MRVWSGTVVFRSFCEGRKSTAKAVFPSLQTALKTWLESPLELVCFSVLFSHDCFAHNPFHI